MDDWPVSEVMGTNNKYSWPCNDRSEHWSWMEGEVKYTNGDGAGIRRAGRLKDRMQCPQAVQEGTKETAGRP